MTKPLVLTPAPVLYQKTKPVGKIDKRIKEILKEMEEALLAAKDPVGVGLAAPQIGYPLRMFAIRPTEKSPVSFYINPKIIEISQEKMEVSQKNTPLEGCLSIPNTWGVVQRKKSLTLSYLNKEGKQEKKVFTGFPAVIIQHEMDHLEGVLFTKRVVEQGRKLYEIIKDEEGEESLKELPL